jgi:hypothetical protein
LIRAAKKVSRLGPYREMLKCSECGWTAETQKFRFAKPAVRNEGGKLARQKFLDHECADFPKSGQK